MSASIALMWFRLDLRLSDNRALAAAISSGARVIPVYIHDPHEAGAWSPGAASRWWLHQSLKSLDQQLAENGSKLIILQGDSHDELIELQEKTGATRLFWNRRYDPQGVRRDQRVEAAFKERGVKVETFNSSLLHEPDMVRTADGNPFRVFTPFWNRLLSSLVPEPPLAAVSVPAMPPKAVQSLPLDELKLEPSIDWAHGLRGSWEPGEAGAQKRLAQFVGSGLFSYSTARDRPDLNGISMLSPHLHFGEIGPRQVWHSAKSALDAARKRDARAAANRDGSSTKNIDVEVFLKELGWREFAYHVLFNFPDTCDQPMRKQFSDFAWRQDPPALRAWQRGKTGYPIVDAGMRQLWHMGWMHNRVRMIVGSFLTKDLLLSWNEGAKWFWDTLVDADLASNTLGWQWCAGCGADAAPYFRIFNPVLQGEKFDPDGHYIRRWV